MASDWITDYIEEVKDTALEAVDDLKTASMNYFDVYWNQQKGNIQPEFTIASAGVFDWHPPTIPDIPEYDDSDIIFTNLTTAAHNTYVWTSEGDIKVKDAIWDIVYNQGVGLSQELQDAIFNADRERKLSTLNDALILVAAQTGARGFKRHNSMTAAAQNELILKYQYDLENQSREITKLMEEHARTNIQFAIQQGISVENFHADFANKYDLLFIEMAKASVELYTAQIEARIKSYEATIRGMIQQLELYKVEADYFKTIAGVMLDKYRIDVEQETNKTNLFFNTSSTNLRNTLNAIDGYAKTAAQIIQSAGNTAIEIATV